DGSLPVDLVGTPGIITAYKSERSVGSYVYRTKFSVEIREPLSAIEVRFLCFDVWGSHVRSLNFTEVVDLPAPTKTDFSAEWSLFSENDVEKHYASIAYVSRVRTQAGKVIEANAVPVIAEAKKFSKKFSADDLEPKPERK